MLARSLRASSSLRPCLEATRADHYVISRRVRFCSDNLSSTPPKLSSLRNALQDGGTSILPRAAMIDAKLSITWPDGKTSDFDYHFLLDHCRCPRCFHAQTKQRLKSLSQIPPAVAVQDVYSDSEGLHVRWSAPSSHESFFPYTFLRRAAYDPPLRNGSESNDRSLWNSKIAKSPPTVSWSSVMGKGNARDGAERGVLRWLDKVHEFGFCFVTDVPANPSDTQKLIERIGNIRQTHYGGFWDFTADMSHGDLAYSAEALPAHTDTAYFTDPAGLQIFHLLSHPSPPGSGGATLLVDGFYAASLLSELHPTSYSLLSRLRVPFHASGTPGTILRPMINQPVLRHDGDGNLVQIRWNNEDRGVLGSGWKPEDIRGWYQAARQFEELGRSDDAEYWVQLAPGTVVVIDNWRVMHGRSAFTGERRMCGAYVGADDWRSRRLALQKQYGRCPEVPDLWDVGW